LINWSIPVTIPLVAILLYGGLFLVVITTRPFTHTRRWFSAYLLAMVGWSVSAFFFFFFIGDTLFWFRLMFTWTIFTLMGLFGFVQALFHKRSWWLPIVFFYLLTTIVLGMFTNLVAVSATLVDGKILYSFGKLIYFINIPSYSLMIYSLLLLYRGYKQTDDYFHRERLYYLYLAFLVILLGTMVNWTPLGKYPIDIAANGLAAIMIAYAILRYQLLEIRVVVRTGLFYTFATAIAGAMYFVVISQALRIFAKYTDTSIFTITAIIAVLTALIFTPIYIRLQSWIDRVFYRSRYNKSLMLQRLSESTATLLDLDKITTMILDELTNTMHIRKIAFFLRENNNASFVLFKQRGSALPANKKIRIDHPVIVWLWKYRRILTKHALDVLPTFRSIWKEEREELERYNFSLYVPLIAKDTLVGILAIGDSRSGNPYTKDDRLMLLTLANQIAIAVENARLYEELEDAFTQTVISLANAIDIRDSYTKNHSEEIATMAAETAKELGMSEEEIQAVYWGGLLHDIGKIGIPDSILLKPGPLTDEEYEKIRYHTIAGAKIIAPIKKLAHVAPYVRASHERYDGNGYPDGLKGDEIPLGARIISVVDSYSAITDDRVYRKARTHEEAIEEIKRCSGTQFDPDVVEAFLHVLTTRDFKNNHPV